MLLAVQILTPVTYAVGDEEFVEESIVQEETPEDVEEVSDDVDDETDDADLDEEEDEDSLSEEDDSFSGDAVDEDSLEMSWDVISDAESESWDVVVIDSESWAVAATGSEVVVESGVDVSWTSGAAWTSESSVTVDDEFITKLSKEGSVAKIAEKLWINWYTDSSEWAIKAWIEWKYLWTKEQNNVIREYFIQHAREILWAQESNEVVNEEVIEEPEVVVELNKEEISWRKYYNGVTAIVLAPVNTFPEGTTLSIVPIKTKKDLNEIKEQLVEQQDEVTEESNVVAFDISFLYSWEEVQPVSGQTVQVTFNYGNHEKLSEANEDEEQELKVYHLNDKDGSGNKVEDIKEVKVEAVDIVKNEEWELVVDAESFSIYTIVTQVAEEWPEALEDQLANFEYGMISIARPDSIAAEWNPEWFTIMDRNLWAEKTWAYTDLTTTGSYWYHYQWWNNYWFISYTGLIDEYKTGNKIDVNWNTEYSWNQFVWWSSNNTWMSWSNNDNLWTWDNKQWPCPEWWHVPTAEEWSQLLEFYVYENYSNNTGNLNDSNGYKWISSSDVASWFAHYFQIPFAGRRDFGDANVSGQGSSAYLWSSTPNGDDARYLFLNSSYVGASYNHPRAYGLSVRCFKNEYVPYNESDLLTVTFNFNGWSWSTASINVVSWDILDIPSDPVKSWFIFDGWYSWDVKVVFSETSPVITEDITLTARYNCAAWTKLVWEICSNEVAVLKEKFRDADSNSFKTLAGDLNYIRKIIRSSVTPLEGSGAVDIWVLWYLPIKAWFDADNWIIYYYTVASSIFFQNGDARNAFGWMPNLEYIDLSWINTSDVTTMKQMFFNQSPSNNSLKVLDLSNFDTSKVTDMAEMFWGLNALKTIYVGPKFVVDNVTNSSNMFNGVWLLIWGYWTVWWNGQEQKWIDFAKIDNEVQSWVLTDPNDFLVQIINGSDIISQHKTRWGTITPIEVQSPNVYRYYTDSAKTVEFSPNTPLIWYTKLYSNLECVEWYEGDGNTCNQLYTLTFDADSNGWSTETWFVSLTSLRTVNLDSFTASKAWYDFVWWNTNSWAHEKLTQNYNNYTISEDTTLYAIFKKTLSASFELVDEDAASSVASPVTCEMFNNDEPCEIESPLLAANVWYVADWWSITSWSHVAEATTFIDGWVYYSVTHYSTPLRAAFIVQDEDAVEEINFLFECYRYNWESLCSITSPNLTAKDWYTIIGWNTNSGANESSLSLNAPIEISTNTMYYSITKNNTPITVTFNVNGNGWSGTTKTCYRFNGASSCFITSPNITPANWYSVIWWSTANDDHINLWQVWEPKDFSESSIYYAQTRKYITAVFYGNGNKLQWDVDQIVTTGYAYNGWTLIVDVPVIQNNAYTDEIIWYSLSSLTGSEIANIWWVILNSGTIADWTAKIQRSDDITLYAQTYKPAVTRTVTYKKWENDSFGIINFASFTDSCTIAAIYNGNNSVPQATWCQLIAPEVQSSNGYEWYWEWPMTKGDQYTVYSDRTISAYSTGEHYSISFYLDGWDWPTGVTQQDSYQEWDTVVINEPVWTGYTFIGWTTWSNTEPVMNVSIQPTDKWAKLFVAHWQQDEYRIIYSDTVQWTTNLVKTYSYNNGSTLVAPNKSPIGYTFKWWIGENGDTPETSVTIPSWVVWDKYFTAVWEPRTYTVTWHLNGWKIGEETSYVFTYDIESGNINLSTPTRDNSTFVGWSGSNGSSPDLNVVISQWSHWDKEYYAVYSCNEWYEANGNTCVLKPYSVTYVLDEWKHTTVNPQETVTRDETSYKINIKNPIKTGYNFLWWTTNIQNATCREGTTERANCRAESANDLTIEFADWQAVTLTAKWAHVPIEVSKQDLIGITPTGTATVTEYGYDSRIDLAAEAMTWYRTLWWSEGTDWVVKYNDNTKEYVRDLTIVYDNPTAVSWGTWRVSLYSVRELINYTIKYVLNEWVQTNPTTYNVTQANIVLTDAVKTWYVFKWWYDADENKITTITPEVVAELTSPYKLTLTARWETSKNTPYKVYHERQWIDGEYYKTNTERTDVDELTWETDKSVTPARRTNYVWFIMPVDQKTDTIKADGSTEIIYQYEREKHTYKYNTVVWATTKWKRSLDADYTTNATTTQMFFDTPIILSWKADTWYSWSWWDITSWGETTRIVAPTYEFNMPLVNVEVTPVVYHIPYTLKFDVNGWTGDSWDLADVYPIYYDSWITYPVVTRMWYTFLGWYDDVTNTRYGSGTEDGNLKMSNSDLTLTAHWQANDFTLNVNHYKMNLSGEYSETPNKIVQIETKIDADLTGTNNPRILPETYKGFTLSGDAVETIHINPDGSSVINYYYSRDKHNVRINENEGVTLSGTMSGEYYYETPVAVEALAKTGYTWSWWNVTTGENEPVFTTDTWVAFILWTGNVILTPLTITNSYHLTIKNDWILVFSWDVLYKTNISQYLTTPSKAGYTFNGWSNRPANDLMPAKDLVIEAKWTYKSNGWGGGGWGGWSSSSDDKKVIINNTWDKQQEHSSVNLTGANLTGTNKDLKENEVKEEQPEKNITDMNFDELKNLSADKLKKVDRTKLTKEENEILDAYEWAYEHNVTTMVTLNDANPEWIVTRGHLAKMVVNYAINVLWQQLPEKVPSECRWNDWRGDWESDEIKDYAVKACSLWLMWLDMKKFSPKLRVTRAQFGTIMSRLLWWKKYAWGTPYYRKHLNALKENNIMTQIWNPEWRVELRQWVWLMLMRAAMDKNV